MSQSMLRTMTPATAKAGVADVEELENVMMTSGKKNSSKQQSEIKASTVIAFSDKTNGVKSSEQQQAIEIKPALKKTVRRAAVTFTEEAPMEFCGKGTYQIGTPCVSQETKSLALKLRHGTPHVNKLKLEELDSEEEADDESEDLRSAGPIPDHLQKKIVQASRALRLERQSKTPAKVSDFNFVYKSTADALPASVRKFIANRNNKPVSGLFKDDRAKAPTPLRMEIRRKWEETEKNREKLFAQIEEFGLDPSTYSSWTMEELEQRVFALEYQRFFIEDELISHGYDPMEFEGCSFETIDDRLAAEEQEGSFIVLDKNEPIRLPFHGKSIEFSSPEPIAMVKPVEDDSIAQVSSSLAALQVSAEDASVEKEAEVVPLVTVALQVESKTFPDPMSMTCEQIRAQLKSRGLKVSGLKNVIAQRLAEAYEQEQ